MRVGGQTSPDILTFATEKTFRASSSFSSPQMHYPFVKLRPILVLRRRPMHVSVVYAASRQSSGAYIPSNHAP